MGGAEFMRIQAQERQQLFKQRIQFRDLWVNRRQVDATPGFLRFLNSENEWLRTAAVRALGRIETKKSLSALKKRLDTVSKAKSGAEYKSAKGVPPLVLRLAIGRIESHDLKGKAKLDTLTRWAGTSYQEVVAYSKLVQSPMKSYERREILNRPTNLVLLEVVDLFYSMKKNGQSIESLGAAQLALPPGLALRLKGASLSTNGEIEMLLNYATSKQGGIINEDYLLGLGPASHDLLLKKLTDTANRPSAYLLSSMQNNMEGYSSLFSAAVKTNDKKFIPLLKKIDSRIHKPVKDSRAGARSIPADLQLRSGLLRAIFSLENPQFAAQLPNLPAS